MKELKIKATPVFYKNYHAKNRVVINRGGAGSSKSYSVLQLMLIYFITLSNIRILILRKTLPANRNSCLVVFKNILSTLIGAAKFITFLKSELLFENYKNGSIVKFASLQDPERIKSSEWDYIVMEEATEFSLQDFRQCDLRLSRVEKTSHVPQIFLMFNPTDEFSWIKTNIIEQTDDKGNYVEDYKEIVSTYKDNPFLSKRFIETLEKTINSDVAWYSVYCLGQWQSLGNRIYHNYTEIDPLEFPEITEDAFLGMDIGMVNETALVLHMQKSDVEVYERELIYQSETTMDKIIEKMDRDFPFIKQLTLPIYVDYASPGAIEELHRANYNAYPANKNVFDGLNFSKKFIYHITSDSVNIIKEHKAYSWQTNRNGIALDKPIKAFDHLMDSRRYSIYTHLFDKVGIRPTMAIDSEPEYNLRSRVHYN